MTENSKNHYNYKAILMAALLLGVFTFAGSSLISLTHQSTSEKIISNQRNFILKNLSEVLPTVVDGQKLYNNDLLADSYTADDTGLGTEDIIIYPAFMDSNPAGAILTSTAENGYNGRIKLIVGIRDIKGKGQIHSVRVVEHKETPGLGDPIELRRSDWILQFDGKSLENPTFEYWKVKKDGGQFDQLTGATVTPRAVIQAIRQALSYYDNNRESIFRAKR